MAYSLMNYLASQNNNRNGEYLEHPNSTEDRDARRLILSTFRNVKITKVRVVHNNYLRGMYELKKMEYQSRYDSIEEKTLVHATSIYNVDSIIKDNLDWRRVTRHKYGKGVSFSDDAHYANCYANRDIAPQQSEILIIPVEMGQTISDMMFGNRESPESSTVVPEPALDAPQSVPEPAVVVSNASVAIPEPTSAASQSSISVPGPTLDTRNAHQAPHLATSPHLSSVDITRVCVVKNTFVMGMYELKKAEYKSRYGNHAVKELTMFHATDANNVDSIVKDNLDWRRVYRNKYGIGVSFSEDPDYCNFHCTPKNGYHRVFIVASVLVCRQTYGDYGMVVPPETYDTAVGNNNLVYVKFNDNEFLPKYLVFYDSPPRSRSKYWINYPRRW